jgi:membrane protein YdbS with pleckstrin-like domain
VSLERIVIPRVWRAEWGTLVALIIASLVAFLVSETALRGTLREILLSKGLATITEFLWLVWCIPIGLFLRGAYRIYNVRYSVDARAIEMRRGILSFQQSITRIRFEDIRSIEARQTVFEQMLGIGNIAIGTAASSGLEIGFSGIANPREVQQVIQQERELRERT